VNIHPGKNFGKKKKRENLENALAKDAVKERRMALMFRKRAVRISGILFHFAMNATLGKKTGILK
jgi:uncharacterized membrane protein (UPF0127 family)